MIGGPDAVSPTAHYTGEVWARHGLSHPALRTLEGRLMVGALRPAELLSRLAGSPTFEGLLLARHAVIDAHLDAAIEAGRVGQIVELAAGMSPRGLRYADRVAYVEVDLPAMAARKRRALERAGAQHRVLGVDVTDAGALDAVFDSLDPAVGVAVVTEGLLNYLPEEAVRTLWANLAAELGGFPHGLYVADVIVGGTTEGLVSRAATAALSVFVRGLVRPHFGSDGETEAALREAGFAQAAVRPAASEPSGRPYARDAGARLIRVLQATTTTTTPRS